MTHDILIPMTSESIPELPSSTQLRERRTRMRARLAGLGLDGGIVTSPSSILYFSGYSSVGRSVTPAAPMAFVFLPDGRDGLIMGRADVPSAVEAGFDPSLITTFGPFRLVYDAESNPAMAEALDRHEKTFIDAVSRVFNRVGTGTKIGVELRGLAPAPLRDLTGWVGETTGGIPASLDQAVWDVRAAKDNREIALIQRAAHIAEEAILEVCSTPSVGKTERDLRLVFDRAIVERGASPTYTVISTGPRSAYVDTPTVGRVLQEGDIIRFDVGCSYFGYQSDIARTAVVGRRPDSKTLALYSAVHEGLQAALESVRPGVTFDATFSQTMDATRRAGIPHYERNHVGHGIGLETYEQASISPGENYTYVPFMTVDLETPYYELGWGGVQVEDPALVTESGAHFLTKSPSAPLYAAG